MGRTAVLDKPTQLNVRIGSELKKNGEAAFAEANMTSSEAIRMLFEIAERHRGEPAYLQNLLQEATLPAPNNESEDLRALLHKALYLVEKGAA